MLPRQMAARKDLSRDSDKVWNKVWNKAVVRLICKVPRILRH